MRDVAVCYFQGMKNIEKEKIIYRKCPRHIQRRKHTKYQTFNRLSTYLERKKKALKITELKLNTDTRYSKSQIEHSRKLGLPVPVGHWKLKNGKLLCSIQPTKSDMEQIKKLRWKGFTAGDIFND